MKRFTALTITAVLAASCSDSEKTATTAPDVTLAARGVANGAPIYLVMLHDDVTDVPGVVRGLSRASGLTPRFVWQAVNGFSAPIPDGRLEAVRNDPRVKLVARDGPVALIKPIVSPKVPPWCGSNPGHPACSGEEDPGSGGQVEPSGVTRIGGSRDGTSKTAWVIDTGVDLDHPDLNVDQGCSANFAARGKDSPDDGHGHGTHVAGTIAALDNSQDVVGVAAGARICAVRVLDNSGRGSYEGVMNGVNYVAANGSAGDVANMSLGGPATAAGDALEGAIASAAAGGIKFALAAGNDGDHANNHSPAKLNAPNVYTISAVGSNDCMPSWSNYGNPPVDFAEPGVGILSTARGGGTKTMSGTSMATPHAAGLLLFGTPSDGGDACNDPAPPADDIGVF